MKKILPGILLILLISFDVFGQAPKKISEAGKQEAKQGEPTLAETVEWLSEKFKTSIVTAYSREKKCINYFEFRINNFEITASKRYSCDGVNYETIYIIPLKSLDSISIDEKVLTAVAPLTIILNCAGGNSCISKQHKDYSNTSNKTTYVSSFDLYKINAKCTNAEIRERIVKALNHAIYLNGGGKLNEKF